MTRHNLKTPHVAPLHRTLLPRVLWCGVAPQPPCYGALWRGVAYLGLCRPLRLRPEGHVF
jgi:hypothetical protein